MTRRSPVTASAPSPLTAAVVRVGDGRGFLVEGTSFSRERERFVITAAHCLPRFPEPHPGSYGEERTYPDLLGPLDGEPSVWAELVFADPIADLAVLGPPDPEECAG